MKTLVFDTCFNKSYVVLSENNEIKTSKVINSDDKNYHSAYLIPVIRDLLVENKLFIKDIDAIGVNIGPGSFTGVRAGVTIARVMCQQFNTRLIGISSLQILSCINKEKTHTTVVMDARKNKVYFAEYENGIEIVSPCLKDKDELISSLKENSFVIADMSIGDFLSEKKIKCVLYENINDNLGFYLSSIVSDTLNTSDDDFNWAKVKPLYIQKPSISKPKEKKSVL